MYGNKLFAIIANILLLESFNYERDNYRNFQEHQAYIETIDKELLMNYVLSSLKMVIYYYLERSII